MRASYIVHGIVQGVGYRALVRSTAMSLGLRGFVRNVPDGSVEIFVVGRAEAIESMLKRIDVSERYGPQVHSIEKVGAKYKLEPDDFTVESTEPSY